MRRQDALRTPAPTPWGGSAPCKNRAPVAPRRASRSTKPYLTHAAPCSPPTTPTLRLPCLSATPPSASTPPPSAVASSRGETTSRSPASASPCSPPRTHPVPSASYPPPGTTSSRARLTRSSAPTTIGGLQPGSPRGVVPGATVRPLLGVPSSFGATSPSCWLWMAPQPTTPLATYTIGRLGAISPPHRDALQHRGLRTAHLRRLLCDVILTTVLLHKRHTVLVLPLADHFSPLTRVPVNQSLAGRPPQAWYHVAKWAPTPGSPRWPAWDIILGLWLSGDLLLAPKVKTAKSARDKCSPYRVLYVYNETNQIPPAVRRKIGLETYDVIILDSLGRHGLAPHLPDRRRLRAIHYGGNGRSLEAGLRGDVIPSWCAALHSAFSAILTAASQGPRTVFKDVHVALGRPAPWPYPSR